MAEDNSVRIVALETDLAVRVVIYSKLKTNIVELKDHIKTQDNLLEKCYLKIKDIDELDHRDCRLKIDQLEAFKKEAIRTLRYIKSVIASGSVAGKRIDKVLNKNYIQEDLPELDDNGDEKKPKSFLDELRELG